MTTANHDVPESGTTEIARLVDHARRNGEADVFSGKRRWVRYNLPMRLEVTTDPDDAGASWSVTMHNIAGGGFGFWSKQALEEGAAIRVREWSRGAPCAWLPARVTHSSIGIRGYLIGAVFADALPPDVQGETTASAELEDGPKHSPAARRPHLSLQTKSAACAALAGGAGAAAAYLACRQLGPIYYFTAMVSLATGFGLFFGGLTSWLLLRGDVGFLEALRTGIRQIAMREPSPLQLAAAPSHELAALRQAFLDLGATWRRHQEDERLARQKLEELNQIKSNILSIVSHDLRTPLTSILLYTQMLIEELQTLEEEDQRRFLGIISDECTRLARLVDDLLEVQRLEAGRARWDIQVRDLSETIRACARLFEAMARSKSMEFTVDCPPTLPPVEADADKISQVLSNLLSNAMKYTPAGGKVRLTAQVSGRDIVLSVADNGPGIPRDKWDQIFDRFSQLANPNVRDIAGCGLGLYIVRQMVERHGGAVWVDSEVGRGSEFFVSLPTRAPRDAAASDPAAVTSAGRVVVCDADPELAAMIAQVLRQEKYEVRQAHSGARLLAQLEHADADVVVTDLLLPDVNAPELLEALVADPRRGFGLVIHSYAGEGPELRQRGVNVYLRRPASRDELLQAVQVAMPFRGPAAERPKLVLLIECERMHMARFRRLFTEAGQMPLMVAQAEEAATLIDNFPVDVVVACVEALSDDWRELERLGPREDGPGFFVLCETVRQHERQLAHTYGTRVIACRRGHEEEVAAAILAAEDQRVQEYAS